MCQGGLTRCGRCHLRWEPGVALEVEVVVVLPQWESGVGPAVEVVVVVGWVLVQRPVGCRVLHHGGWCLCHQPSCVEVQVQLELVR